MITMCVFIIQYDANNASINYKCSIRKSSVDQKFTTLKRFYIVAITPILYGMVVVTTMWRNMTSSSIQNSRIHTQTNWNIDTLCVWYETNRQLIHAHVDHSDYIVCFNKYFSMSSWAELSIWFRKHYTTKFNDRDESNTKWYYNHLEI